MPEGNVRILFVCTGNICRSPTAEGVMRKFVQQAGLQHLVVVDSAGTHDYYAGEPPDPRAQDVARRRGYDLTPLRARQLVVTDFETFDVLLAMDKSNLALLQCMCPDRYRSKIRLLMNYADKNLRSPVIPDPYGRDRSDFEMVLDYIEDACKGLMQAVARSNTAVR
ncbi:low molecular weight phosphotyrosine protein phosphatase [Noviherbaspirillum cavernae]|uniref:protein-tyrosine-phosphatase n=1 Tax=Noviherbaspirillum cavernae TaxID=2320862 RepID=A0A418X684_9BURK|nr:low molecular weight phosphotyrosine protein phosphatase [Noviherbaspirillum cavernae]